jgi:hypothetical protein
VKLDEHLIDTLAQVPLELERLRNVTEAGLAQSHNSAPLTGARHLVAGPAGRAMAWGGAGRLVGWSVRSTGGASTVTLRDSRDTSGEIIAVINLVAETSETQCLPAPGISFGEGLNATVTGPGVLEGAYWLGAVD